MEFLGYDNAYRKPWLHTKHLIRHFFVSRRIAKQNAACNPAHRYDERMLELSSRAFNEIHAIQNDLIDEYKNGGYAVVNRHGLNVALPPGTWFKWPI